jgi:translation initiation factor IF-1
MAARQPVEVTGTVVEQLPHALYRVRLDGRQQVLAHLSGGLRRNFIRLLAGDRVVLELSPRDLSRGRITRKVT